MDSTTFAVFEDREMAENAIKDLKSRNYLTGQGDISIIMKDKAEKDMLIENTDTNIAEDTARGAVTGGVVGIIAGLLVGAGTIAFPPIGGLVIAGPIATALGISTTAASAIAGGGIGALGGGLVAGLVSLGLSNDDAELYQDRIENNGIVLGVKSHSPESQQDVEDILIQNGGDDIRRNY